MNEMQFSFFGDKFRSALPAIFNISPKSNFCDFLRFFDFIDFSWFHDDRIFHDVSFFLCSLCSLHCAVFFFSSKLGFTFWILYFWMFFHKLRHSNFRSLDRFRFFNLRLEAWLYLFKKMCRILFFVNIGSPDDDESFTSFISQRLLLYLPFRRPFLKILWFFGYYSIFSQGKCPF